MTGVNKTIAADCCNHTKMKRRPLSSHQSRLPNRTRPSFFTQLSSSPSTSVATIMFYIFALSSLLSILSSSSQYSINAQVIPQAYSEIYDNAVVMPPTSSKLPAKMVLEWEERSTMTDLLPFSSSCALNGYVNTADSTDVNNNVNMRGLKSLRWRLSVGISSRFVNVFYGFSDGSNGALWSAIKKVSAQSAQRKDNVYSSNVKGKWTKTMNGASTATTDATLSVNYYSSLGGYRDGSRLGEVNPISRPNFANYVPLSSLNLTFGDVFTSTKILYNTQGITSARNLVPLLVDTSALKAASNLSVTVGSIIEKIGSGNRSIEDTSFVDSNGFSVPYFLRTRSEITMDIIQKTGRNALLNSYENQVTTYDFTFRTTNCYQDMVGSSSSSSSNKEIYFFALVGSYFPLMNATLTRRLATDWDSNFAQFIVVYNLTDFFNQPTSFATTTSSSDSTSNKFNMWNDQPMSESAEMQSQQSVSSFQDASAVEIYSMFHYNPTETYKQLRYLRMSIVLFFSLLIMVILVLSRKSQPVKSRFLINGSVCAVAIVYGLLGIIFAAALPSYDSIVSSMEVLFYLVLGFLYVLSAMRYFFSRNLYRTMRINFSSDSKSKKKDKRMTHHGKKISKGSQSFEERQLKLLRLLANLASWKVFLVGVILVLVVICALSLFILISVVTGTASNFDQPISTIATYTKLAGLLGLVVPTAILSIIVDAIINAKKVVKKGLHWYLIQDDPLFFRLEFGVFIPAVIFGVLLFILDQYYNTLNWFDMNQRAVVYLVHGLIYSLFEFSLVMLGCGGFIAVVYIIQYSRMAIRRKSLLPVPESKLNDGSTLGKKTEFELFMCDDEARVMLQQYCEREFSLENYLLFELVEELAVLASQEHPGSVNKIAISPALAKPSVVTGEMVEEREVLSTTSISVKNGKSSSGSAMLSSDNTLVNSSSGSLSPRPSHQPPEQQHLNVDEPGSPTSPSSVVSASEPSSPSVKNLMKNNNRESVTQQIDRIILKILKTYLNENSVLEVNLPNTTRKMVLSCFRKRLYADDVSKFSGSKSMDHIPERMDDKPVETLDMTVLDTLKQDVWLNLKDTFGRLQLTQEYNLYKAKKTLEKELNVV
ncbi:hypothetical protein C9374_010659 [Naegleria lovaniensis]|uniref:RGS domain-containing protein n=1 Tax=Naegleria lovaniensis TaxID=51637 RepID=A0AA88GBG9_NAELO|nr:uncharacterized protein C9374_010634 [Naegleria lovaniensis]XP_044543814.1 uncharacterized protein C9374_010659 [Naegleria lovaniensis]KAG2374615.1 hypothetical protein C9374_010634 [Naegleria lovaniensis]KAG2374640.1 hypothetical protein C9374_010659 [Naegleria lovaniensis]